MAVLHLPRDKSEEELVAIATTHPNVVRFIEGKRVVKTVVVPNKLINVVV